MPNQHLEPHRQSEVCAWPVAGVLVYFFGRFARGLVWKPDGLSRLVAQVVFRKSTWIDLVCNDSHGFEKYYEAAEELIKEVGARPHLGKYCQTLRKEDLANAHGNSFVSFLQIAQERDPEQKFVNQFTRRIFWQ